jgi:hypothetical protein
MLPAGFEIPLPQVIRQVLGSKVEIGGSTVLNRLDDYLVVVVDLLPAPSKVVVKVAGPAAIYRCPFDRTASILLQVATNDDPLARSAGGRYLLSDLALALSGDVLSGRRRMVNGASKNESFRTAICLFANW